MLGRLIDKSIIIIDIPENVIIDYTIPKSIIAVIAHARSCSQPRVDKMADDRVSSVRLESPKGAKSPYWAHFGFEVNQDGKRLDEKNVLCRICSHKVGYSGNTTNLGQHLQKWHPEVLTGEAKSSKQQLTLESCSVRPISKLPSGSKRAQEITRKIAEFIVRDMRPVATIEGAGL